MLFEKNTLKRLKKEFDYVGHLVQNRVVISKNHRYGLVDENGTIIVPPKYCWADTTRFDEDYLCVRSRNGFGYIDINNGHEVVKTEHKSLDEAEKTLQNFKIEQETFLETLSNNDRL